MAEYGFTSNAGISYPIISDGAGRTHLPYGLIFATAVYAGVDDEGEGDSVVEINVAPTAAALDGLFVNLIPLSLRHAAHILMEKAEEIEHAYESGSSQASAVMAAFGDQEGER